MTVSSRWEQMTVGSEWEWEQMTVRSGWEHVTVGVRADDCEE